MKSHDKSLDITWLACFLGIEAISTEVEKPLKPVLQNILQEEDSINSNSSRNMCAHYKPSLPHIPKKQQSTRSSLSRSRSCDHLAVQVDSDQRNRNKTADEKNSDKSVSPLPAMASKKVQMKGVHSNRVWWEFIVIVYGRGV